jgi:acetolactate synthase-1/3 small subunit
LTVGPTEEPGISRITIITDESTTPVEQVVNQLRKLIYVRKVDLLDEDNSVQCEVALIKVARTDTNVNDILTVKNRFHTIVVDESADTITIQSTEPAPVLRELVDDLRQFGIVEVTKSGTIALGRGNSILKNTHHLGEAGI